MILRIAYIVILLNYVSIFWIFVNYIDLFFVQKIEVSETFKHLDYNTYLFFIYIFREVTAYKFQPCPFVKLKFQNLKLLKKRSAVKKVLIC